MLTHSKLIDITMSTKKLAGGNFVKGEKMNGGVVRSAQRLQWPLGLQIAFGT
jgi:hypothetical protein